MKPRLLIVGVGPLGRVIARDFLTRGLGEIAAAVDIDPALSGRAVAPLLDLPAGTAAQGGLAELKVVPSVPEALRGAGTIDAALVATSSELARCMPVLRELLSRGISVVSTCEELLFPWLDSPALAQELHELCLRHDARCVGTGVNPGFLMDTLPVALTAVCGSVTRVRVERTQDASTRRVPFQRKIGATLSDDEFDRRVAAKTLRHVGLGESLHFIDRALSMGVVRWSESIAPVRAQRALDSALGPIPAGGISGVRQTAHGWNAADQEVITLEFQAAIGQENPRDRVLIEGSPTIESIIPGAVHGDVATSAIALNTIPRLLEAPPGLHTMASLPVVRFVRG